MHNVYTHFASGTAYVYAHVDADVCTDICTDISKDVRTHVRMHVRTFYITAHAHSTQSALAHARA